MGNDTDLPPIADFEANYTVITAGDAVNYTDSSLHNPLVWDWALPGATPDYSNLQNPTVTYLTAGIYPAKLGVINAEGNDTKYIPDYILVNPAPSLQNNVPPIKKAPPKRIFKGAVWMVKFTQKFGFIPSSPGAKKR